MDSYLIGVSRYKRRLTAQDVRGKYTLVQVLVNLCLYKFGIIFDLIKRDYRDDVYWKDCSKMEFPRQEY